MKIESLNDIQADVIKLINQTNQSVFLTGKAGTGKTTLLKKIINTTHKNTIVVAPTGIAALNAGGVTIHSMFQLAPSGYVPDPAFSPDPSSSIRLESISSLGRTFKISGARQAVLKAMDLLVIDEVSMLRADLLDAMDFVMRRVRRREQPFGGVQVLFIGDLLQLPPVVKPEEWQVLQNYYKGIFFFHANVIQKLVPLYVELKKIYRQVDDRFISVLNNLRNNMAVEEDISILSKYVKPDFDLRKHQGYIYLTTHNRKADEINLRSLNNLTEKPYSYKAEIEGEFPDKIFPIDEVLTLKVGAQIMFTKNDITPQKLFYNGKMGVIKSLSKEEIIVHFPDENTEIQVEKYEWSNVKYKIDDNTKDIEEEVIGTFVQYPIKLAWAITIHKSQGLTFEKAVLDVTDVFQPGQAYVALSRLKSLDGLVLVEPIKMKGIQNARDVISFAENEADEEKLKQTLTEETKKFIASYLKQAFDFSPLIYQWRKHGSSYDINAALSEKTKHASWAKEQVQNIEQIAAVAKKFLMWLDASFSENPIDYDRIYAKIIGARDHFFPVLDTVLDQVLTKMEALKRVKRVKEYYIELMELEEITSKSIIDITRSNLLLKTYIEGGEINKASLTNDFIKNYRSNKIASIRDNYINQKRELIEEEMVDYDKISTRYKKQKTVQKDKKSTYEITFELWNEKKSLSDIARERKLSATTIESHMARLIEEDRLSVHDILEDEKIRMLDLLFEGYQGGSLTEMKEKSGDAFTFGELKIYRASIKNNETS